MKNKIILIIVIAFIFLFALSVSAMTEQERQDLLNQLQAKILEIQEQINQIIQQRITTGSSSSTWCYTFNNNLGFAQSGTAEVAALHIVLDKENISYSPDTGMIYSPATESAVKVLQGRYGVSQTGWFGPITRAHVNEFYGCGQATTTGTQTTTTTTTITNTNTNSSTNTNTTNTNNQTAQTTCTPYWACRNWSDCVNGTRYQVCDDLNTCTATHQKTVTEFCIAPTTTNTNTTNTNTTNTNTNTNTTNTNTTNTNTNTTTTTSCTPNWVCRNWSDCVNKTKTRTCDDFNRCSATNLTKTESLGCTVCTPNWSCTDWSECNVSREKTRTCTDLNKCDIANITKTEKVLCAGCTSNWSCVDWSECLLSDPGTGLYFQTRKCVDPNKCNDPTTLPSTQQSCQCQPKNMKCEKWSECYLSSQTQTCTDEPINGVAGCMMASNRLYSETSIRECYSPNAGGATATKRAACIASGGTYSPRYCSGSFVNYASTCKVPTTTPGSDQCALPPGSGENIVQMEVCVCPTGKCWDGNSCISIPSGQANVIPGYVTPPSWMAQYVPVISKFYPLSNCTPMSGTGITSTSGVCSIDYVSNPNSCANPSYLCPKPSLVVYSDPSTYQNFGIGWSATGATKCMVNGYNEKGITGTMPITIMSPESLYYYMITCTNENSGFSASANMKVQFTKY